MFAHLFSALTYKMGLFRGVCIVLLLAVAWTQELQNCTVDTDPFTVRSTDDVATLVASLECSNGDFTVQWLGEVLVEETIHVTNGTSINITGAGPGATANGGDMTRRLFFVDGGSSLQLSGMSLTNGAGDTNFCSLAVRRSR